MTQTRRANTQPVRSAPMAVSSDREVEPGGSVTKRRVEPFVFAALVVLQALPLVTLRYFPSEDGSAHVASAEILNHFHGSFAEVFRIRWFVPNLAGHLLLAGFVRLTDPVTASRIMVGLIVVAIPCAVRFAVRSIRPDSVLLSYAGLPLAVNFFLHRGLYNFSLGLVLFFVIVGYWYRVRDDLDPVRALGLGALFLITLVDHAVPFMMAVFVVGMDALWPILTRAEGDAAMPARHRLRTAFLAALPSLILLATYTVLERRGAGARWGLSTLLVNLVTFNRVLTAFNRTELVFSTLVALVLGVLTLVNLVHARGRTWRDPSWALMACAVVVLLAYLALPDTDSDGGGGLTARLGFFIVAFVLLWNAQFRLRARDGLVIAVALSVAAFGLLGARWSTYRAFDREVAEYVSIGPVLRPGATLVPLNFVQDDNPPPGLQYSKSARPTLQASGWLMAERKVVDLSHFEAYLQFFPIAFRDGVDPKQSIGKGKIWIDQSPPDVRIVGRDTAPGHPGAIDYVLVFGLRQASPAVRHAPGTQRVLAQLGRGYRRVAVSKPRGLVQVYERR
jgi:hypothetical protein